MPFVNTVAIARPGGKPPTGSERNESSFHVVAGSAGSQATRASSRRRSWTSGYAVEEWRGPAPVEASPRPWKLVPVAARAPPCTSGSVTAKRIGRQPAFSPRPTSNSSALVGDDTALPATRTRPSPVSDATCWSWGVSVSRTAVHVPVTGS